MTVKWYVNLCQQIIKTQTFIRKLLHFAETHFQILYTVAMYWFQGQNVTLIYTRINKSALLRKSLNPSVGNHPVVTYAHLSQVDWIAWSQYKKVLTAMCTLSQSARKWQKIYLSLFIAPHRGLKLLTKKFEVNHSIFIMKPYLIWTKWTRNPLKTVWPDCNENFKMTGLPNVDDIWSDIINPKQSCQKFKKIYEKFEENTTFGRKIKGFMVLSTSINQTFYWLFSVFGQFCLCKYFCIFILFMEGSVHQYKGKQSSEKVAWQFMIC